MYPQGCVPADSTKQFMATASCLSEFTHVVDVLLYGQLSLIVIVYLSTAKQQCEKTPFLDFEVLCAWLASLFVQ